MEIQKSNIVSSLAGRDKGKLFFVIDREDSFALLADGKGRKIEKPKRKKLKHLRFIANCSCLTAEKISSGEKVTNSELRRALAAFAAGADGEEGGM